MNNTTTIRRILNMDRHNIPKSLEALGKDLNALRKDLKAIQKGLRV